MGPLTVCLLIGFDRWEIRGREEREVEGGTLLHSSLRWASIGQWLCQSVLHSCSHGVLSSTSHLALDSLILHASLWGLGVFPPLQISKYFNILCGFP